jgi:pimeloyl-ACP methyl ester carboxylesterase
MRDGLASGRAKSSNPEDENGVQQMWVIGSVGGRHIRGMLATRYVTTRLRAVMHSAITLAGLVLAVLVARVEQSMAQKPPAGPAPGRLVDVGGHKMHIRCAGPAKGGPTVILEAGGGSFSSDWSRVQSILSPDVGVCAYDRAGLGWSEPGPAPRTMKQEVFELHLLLEAAGAPGPYLLAGQSIGGLLVRLYTARYAEEVMGVVLVDATHESDMLGSLRYGGWVRLREKALARVVPEPRREGKAATQYSPDDDYSAEEFQQLYLSRKANPVPFEDRPLIVLAAGKRPAPPGTSDELWAQMRIEKDGQRIDLSRLSNNSKFVLDPQSTHAIHLDNPQLVARSIREVLTAVSTGARLMP